MSKQLRITATEDGETIARFDSTDDAMTYAAAATDRDHSRTITLTDRAGWVHLSYSHGFTTDI